MSDQCVGEIRMFAGNYAPQGWALCDGSMLRVADQQMLFSLIGSTYGGDGQTTFALPDLRGRLPLGQGTSASGTNFPLAAKGGVETVALTADQMPGHAHAPMATSAPATLGSPSQNLMAKTVNSSGGTNQDIMYLKQAAPVLGTYLLKADAVTTAGSNQPHNNLMPSLAVNFIIALEGVYPEAS